MRKALIIAAGLALLGTPALSQSMSRDREDYPRSRWNDSNDRWDRDGDHMDRRAMRDDDEDGGRSGRNARFFVRNGDTQLRVVCGDRESMQACVDSALRMFDRVQSQSRATPGSPSNNPTPQ